MNPIQGIYSLCDTSLNSESTHLELAEKLLAGGVKILQLRMKGEKNLNKVREVAISILALKRRYPFTFILNDYVEIAAELGVDGVHIGQDDLGILETRAKLGRHCLVGYSSHSLEEALSAERQGADYVALGAIYPTATKGPGHPVQGVETLKGVVSAIKIPVVAIGGIQRKNFSEVVKTGVAAVAMIGALTCAKDITEEAKWFVEQWETSRL